MSGGGKGGSNQTVAFYYVPIAFAICEGPIVGIKKIWAGGNLIFSDSQPVAVNTYQGGGKKSGPTVSTSYQQFSSSTQNDIQTGGSALGPWTCYLGTETQPPDPTIGEGVAYRGLAYIVFNPLNIGPGATVPPLTFEVVTAGSLAPPAVLWTATNEYINSGPCIVLDNGGVAATGWNNTTPIFSVANGALMSEVLYPLGSRQSPPGYIFPQGGFCKCNGKIYVACAYYFYYPPYGPNNGAQQIGEVNPDNGFITPVYTFPASASTTFATLLSDGDQYIAALTSNSNIVVFEPLTGSLVEYSLSSIGTVSSVTLAFVINGVAYGYIEDVDGVTQPTFFTIDLKTGAVVAYSASDISSTTFESMTTDGTSIYVVGNNGSASKVYRFSLSFALQSSFVAPNVVGSSLFYNGVLWVNTYRGPIVGYSPNGNLLFTLSVGGELSESAGLIFVTSTTGTGASNIGTVTCISPGRAIISSATTLPEAVTILCQRAGIQQFDVSQLPPTPVNFVRGDTVTARSMLQRLSQAYFFSMVDSGGVLKFVPWGQPSLGVIPLEDLGYGKASVNAYPPFTATRISGVDLPRSVKIRYFSPAMNWERYEQIFALESYDSGKEVTLDLPLILDDQTAYNIAALACTLPHAERMQYSFTTSYKWLCVEPGDVWTLPFGTVRIQTVKLGQKNGIPVIDFTACIDGINALAGAGYAKPALPNYQPGIGGITALLAPANLSTTTTVSSATPHPIATAPQIQQTVPNAGTPKMVLTEPPPLRSTDTGMRFYAGAYSTGNAFPGAAIFQSTDGGNTYSQLLTVLSATGAGYANTVLGQPNATEGFYTWDTVNTVDIYMLGGGTLGPLTDLQVMNGGNGAMLGYELIQFANATLMTDSYGNPFYRLSRLLRGRRGTEWAMGAHQVGDPFYLIPSALVKESYTPPMLNNPMLYKVVMMGGDLGNAPAVSYEPSGASLMQWAVCDPACVQDSAGDWTVSWTPRARYNGDWASGYIPTLDSDTAGWSIDVLNGTTVTRTIAVPLTQTAPWQTVYTAAMQSADGFTPGQSGITFNIYQLSATVGRGAVRSITTP